MTIIFRFFLYINLFLFVDSNFVFAGSNNGTTGTYGVTSDQFYLSTNETYTNNGTILGWRRSLNGRYQSGTTVLNNEGAIIRVSGAGAITYGGVLAEGGASGNIIYNYGTISAGGQTLQIDNSSNNTLINYSTGLIEATGGSAVQHGSQLGGASSIDNRGSITATAYGVMASTRGGYTSSYTFTNSGTISTNTTSAAAVLLNSTSATATNSAAGSITSGYNGIDSSATTLVFSNSGMIDATNHGLALTNTNATITNTGTIKGTARGIKNNNIINTLNNSQGAGNVNGALTYEGKLPTNYNTIINSSSNYGKLSVTSGTDSLIFGIHNTSNVTSGTYEDVLTGVSTSNLSSLTGTYGAYNWTLASDGTNYDLTIAASRSAYNQTVTSSKLINTASKLETIRTNGTKTTLTNTLDNLSAAQLESAVKKIQGATIVRTSTQPVQAQLNFKTVLSTVTSPGSSSKITNLTKTNQGNLTFADLQTNNLYTKIQSVNYSDDSTSFDYKNNQAPVNALEFFKSNRNINLVEKDDLKDSGFFLRTFGSVTNYAAINSDDNSYGSDSYGLLGGFQHKIDENLYQGYSLGFSKSKLTLDAGEGNTKTNTIHANVYRKMDEKEYGATASLGGYVSFIDNVRNISETSEILKSSPTNGGVDFSVQYVKKMELLGLNFYPSASLTATYGIVENYKETGGSGSALEIKSHNILTINPEIGFTLENNFVQTGKITEGANFSLFANRQQYLDGHTNTSSMIGENSWSASTLPKTKDDFLTAGIGYVAKNIDEKSDLNFNFFYTQSTNNSLNSSLFSISYNKTF
jgi:hypothetical protein